MTGQVNEPPLTERISCQEQLLPGTSLQQKWEAAQQAGFNAIELRGKGDLAFEGRRLELQRAVADGVVMPTVCVEMLHFIGDFDEERRRDAVRQMRSQLSMIAAIGGEMAITPASYGQFSRRLPPFEPPRRPEDDRAVLLEALAELGEHAEREGVVLGLEPLNRYENHMVNTLADAVSLCKEIGLPSVRVAADTYHMNIEEADPAEALLDAAPWLGHVQVSDSNRLEPGGGHVDWSLLLSTLNAIAYPGWLAFECRLSGDATEVLPRSVSMLRRAAS
ncbi:Sugar phosphate isomerase/epimerase [Micromonospora rhizosphaerae]|uniref:Sugar phosphate isomerase/epimerase n=1 Tax=Micromonospora rhizosphaerae TaxID=568872 RepID=A0A1C6T1F8_9ACTN|nr:sugar phosphate isomerase/epimerase family protein [Micromonospora rhizosphaerae]SCL35660.1 Sugar phosphate isomerase/epimerase [Micromonospora rhizosphaerae]